MFGYLLSFHYYRETDLDALAEAAGEPRLTFFADSGAFSAEHAGASITVEDYARWLKRWAHRVHAYANLDVLHDARRSRRNYEELKAHGLDPIPVWHIGGTWDELDRILAEADYVAIGGMVRASLTKGDRRLWRYLDEVHRRAEGTRLHGFGLGAWRLIERYPWFSADSSLASMGFRYGTVSAYDPYANTWRQWHLRDRKAWGRQGWLVREYGLTPEDFGGSNVDARAALISLAARSWSLAAERLAARIYTTPHLSVASVKGPTSAPVGQELMRTYEDANREGTRLYVVATNNRAQGQIDDLAGYERDRSWATSVYIADPHPSANKNVERIARWQAGNRWSRVDGAEAGADGRLPASPALPLAEPCPAPQAP